jgi:protein-L-isoaspartate O-methyltransferase
MAQAAHMTTGKFEALYQRDPDPWRYASSAYERNKYAATLAACGPGPFASALELGGSIGIFTAALAPLCRTLVSVDAAPTAVREARRRLAGADHVEVTLGEIPESVPEREYDLIVASEILYYLEPAALAATLAMIAEHLRRGGRLVAVHWRPAGPERPFTAEEVHTRLGDHTALGRLESGGTDDYLLDVLVRK